MAFTIDLSGLILFESEVAVLQAQQAASPTTFTGGQTFTATYKTGNASGVVGTQSSFTTAQLVARLQALLLAVQSLPQ
jgi:hypothetical protein